MYQDKEKRQMKTTQSGITRLHNSLSVSTYSRTKKLEPKDTTVLKSLWL
uniref:Uncharacterized protein n=1 Tax=Arundo donax TaxID=35708 RepID=A0A0A9FFN3_ARUDO